MQREVRTLIECKDACNLQVLQDWTTFRWSWISLLSHPAAELIRMNVHLESRSIQPLGNTSGGRAERTWISRKIGLEAREIQNHLTRTAGCSYHSDQEAYSGILERANSRVFSMKGSLLMSLFNGIEWTKKGNTEIQARTVVLLGARVSKDVVERIADGWHIQVSQLPPDISSDRAILAWTVEERTEQLPFPTYMRKKKEDSHHYHDGQAICCVFTTEFSSDMRLKNLVLMPRKDEDEEHIDPEPEQLTFDYAEKAENATSSKRLVATTHREPRNADSQSSRTGRICPNYADWTILHHRWVCYGWKQLHSFLHRIRRATEFSKFKITCSSSRSREDLASDRNRSIRICRNFGRRSTSTVTTIQKFEVLGVYHEELKNTHDNIFLQRRTTKILKPRHHISQQAAGDRERR